MSYALKMPGSIAVMGSFAKGSEGAGEVAHHRPLAEDGVLEDARAPELHPGPDQAALHLAARAGLGIPPQHAVAEAGPRAHADVRDEHGVGPEARPGLDLAPGPDV